MRRLLLLWILASCSTGCAARVAHVVLDTSYQMAKFAAETTVVTPLKLAHMGAQGAVDAAAAVAK
jgi:hypothetical protein